MIAFGVSPAIILYLWVAADTGRGFGWLFALAYAVCMALRLARFNAHIDAEDQPHKSAGFLTGVPAPAGAGLLLLPILSVAGQRPAMDLAAATIGWSRPGRRFSAFLVISSVATFSLGLAAAAAQRPAGGDRRHRHCSAARCSSAPWETLSVVALALSGADPVQHR